MQEKWLLIKKALRLFPSQKRFHKAATTKVINCWPNYVLFESWIDLIFFLLPLPFIDWKKTWCEDEKAFIHITCHNVPLGWNDKGITVRHRQENTLRIQAWCCDTNSSSNVDYFYTTRLVRIQNGSFNSWISADQIIKPWSWNEGMWLALCSGTRQHK